MAVIGKIRKHSALLVILIGVALAGFVLQDFFRKSGRNGHIDTFAKIAGEKILKSDFDLKVEEQATFYKQQTKKENLTSAEQYQMMISAWNMLERQVIMQKEYEELGLAIDHGKGNKPSISPDELYDLMMGKNLHPYIVQNFSDPKTGKVNVQQVQNIIENFDQLKDDEKLQWKRFEEGIKEDRLNTKYNTLVSKGYYVPKAFLQRYSVDANKIAKIRLYGVKYQTIPDTAITVTEEDYKKYYEEHKHEYEQDKTCDIDYVIFEVVPSAEDLAKINEKVQSLYKTFQTLELKDVENFIKANSDKPYDSNFYKKGTLPVKLDSIMFSSPVGTIVPPYVDNNAHHFARLMQIQDRPDSVKASHILIAYKDAPNPLQGITRTKEEAKAKADSLYKIAIKDVKLFGALAAANSDFPSAKEDNGDLGWFADGDPNFKFFFDSSYMAKPGDVKIIQSNMGYHVLYIADKKEPVKKVKVAILTVDIKPSSETYNKFLSMASEFAGTNRTAEQFNKSIAEKGLNKRNAQYVREMDYTIPGLESARGIIRWAFDKNTKKGMVSEQVYESDGKFVVAMLVEKREKGIPTLEQIKSVIEPLVKREKKSEKIIEQINSTGVANKDLYLTASKMNVKVDTLDQITFGSPNLPGFGYEPGIIGSIFAMTKGSLSAPLKGRMAVYQIIVDDIIEPQVQMNTDMIKMQLMSSFSSRVNNDLFTAIKNKTEIIDNRIYFY